MYVVKNFLASELFQLGETVVTVATLLTVVLILFGTWFGSRLTQRTVARAFEKRNLDSRSSRSLSRLASYIVFFVGLGIAVDTAGIKISTLVALGAVFAVGVGLAVQSLTENFVSGLILLFERSIRPGDVIDVDGMIVEVQQLGIRSTLGRTPNGEELIIPNSSMVHSTVKNHTLSEGWYRIHARVGVAYESDLREVRQALVRAVERAAAQWDATDRPNKVWLHEFGPSSIVFDVAVWVDAPLLTPERMDTIQQAIWEELADAGIRIAFPQLDVHLRQTAAA